MKEYLVLDLGCGRAKTTGSIGVDRSPETDADVVADVDAKRLPFKDCTFSSVIMNDALEHVSNVGDTLAEIHRILKPGGEFRAQVPHFTSLHAFSDFTHRHFFSLEGVKRLAGDNERYGHYDVKGFRLKRARLKMWKIWRLLGVELIANRFPQTYEKLFAFSFPSMFIEFCLTKEDKC